MGSLFDYPKVIHELKVFNMSGGHIMGARFSMPALLSGEKQVSFKAARGKNSLPWASIGAKYFLSYEAVSEATCLSDSRLVMSFSPSSQKLKLTCWSWPFKGPQDGLGPCGWTTEAKTSHGCRWWERGADGHPTCNQWSTRPSPTPSFRLTST